MWKRAKSGRSWHDPRGSRPDETPARQARTGLRGLQVQAPELRGRICGFCQSRFPLALLAAASGAPNRFAVGLTSGLVVSFECAILRDSAFVVLTGVRVLNDSFAFFNGELEVRVSSISWIGAGAPPEPQASRPS
jgi:hypothetical protein